VHTWERTTEHPHCGRCSQCLDRRVAALPAGLADAEDPPGGYARDVFTDPLEGADLILAERFVGGLLRAEQIPDAGAFLRRYPEVSRVLRYVDEPPARAAGMARDLYLRHAGAVRAALAAVVRREGDHLVRRRRPVNCLLNVLLGQPATRRPAGPPGGPGPVAPCPCRLECDEATFEARFRGRACFLGNTVEFRLLGRLARQPGTYVSYAALRDDVWGDDQTADNTIQRTACNLRRRLSRAGLDGVEVDGGQRGHYRLVVPA
jgi:hypothetical protein